MGWSVKTQLAIFIVATSQHWIGSKAEKVLASTTDVGDKLVNRVYFYLWVFVEEGFVMGEISPLVNGAHGKFKNDNI